MTDEKIIVLVSDKDDSKHGEISVLDDPQQAERLVETLLEAGFEQGRIRVFAGNSNEFQVSHRPVVALTADGDEEKPRPAAVLSRREDKAREAPVEETLSEEAVAVEPAAEEAPVERTVAAAATQTEPAEQPEAASEEEEKVPETAEAGPTKFSSLFRSA